MDFTYRDPWQLKKSKSWEPFWSYQLHSTAISPIWPNFEVNGLDWQCHLAGSSKTAPRILIFLIAMDADNSFFEYIISVVAMVSEITLCSVPIGT